MLYVPACRIFQMVCALSSGKISLMSSSNRSNHFLMSARTFASLTSKRLGSWSQEAWMRNDTLYCPTDSPYVENGIGHTPILTRGSLGTYRKIDSSNSGASRE